MREAIHRLAIILLASTAPACGSSMADGESEPTERDFGDRQIEESDLYKLEGDWLYVQNPSSGLHVIDVSNPDHPVAVTHVDITGHAGELYVQDSRVLIVFEQTESPCEIQAEVPPTEETITSEIAVVTSPLLDSRIAGRYCLPGIMVASRIVGDILYAVTADRSTSSESSTWIFSIDVSDSMRLTLSDVLVTTQYTHEVHVNDEAVFLAQHSDFGSDCWGGCTNVRYIDISDPAGALYERGHIIVGGEPQGRFHMDATEDFFRIITFRGSWSGTSLHVIDIRDPANLKLAGSLDNIAWDEDLHAARFVGDMAYIVTYENRVLFRDPLWIISLENPVLPEIVGHLEVPGWSDWIFPCGDRLLAVGRGDRGASVAVSLFDIADPEDPAELRRIEFGRAEATSEANLDFRGIGIVESLEDPPLITVPYTNNTWPADECVPEHYLQLVDLLPDDLALRGTTQLDGRIRRTVPIGGWLYSITDEIVASLDVSDRAAPTPGVVLDLAAPGATDPCLFNDFDIPPPDPEAFSYFAFGCTQAGPRPPGAGVLALVVLALLVIASGRHRER